MRDRNRLIVFIACVTPLIAQEGRTSQSESAELRRLSGIQQRIMAGDLASATAELERAVSQSPRDPRLFNFRGVIEAQRGSFAAAEASFRRAIELSPGFAEAYLNLGRLYQEHPDERNAIQKAIDVYQRMLKKLPDHVEANYQAASLLTRLGRYADSMQHLSRLPPEFRERAPALALRCANAVALGRTAQGRAAATQLLASPGLSEPDVIPILPVLIANQGEEIALSLLTGLQTRALASPETLHKLAALHEKYGRPNEARAVLERSPELAHPSAAFLTRIAQLAWQAKDPDGALGYLARARTLEPENAAIHFFFGMICVELKLPPEAKAALQEAVRIAPDNPSYNYALGAVLVGQKNADEAIAYFRKYRDARPEDPRGAFALGVAYFDAYELDSARQVLLSVAEKPETRPGAQLYLGRVALSDGRTDDALRHFLTAIEANPGTPEPYAEAALIRIRRGEYTLAETALNTALEINPDHYLSNLRLLMLYQKTKDPRTPAQAARVDNVRKAGEEKERLLLRALEIRPY